MNWLLFYLDFNVFIYPEVARRVSIKVVPRQGGVDHLQILV